MIWDRVSCAWDVIWQVDPRRLVHFIELSHEKWWTKDFAKWSRANFLVEKDAWSDFLHDATALPQCYSQIFHNTDFLWNRYSTISPCILKISKTNIVCLISLSM
jgi:hypothetical protein